MKQWLGLIILHYLRILSKLQLAKINLLRKLGNKKKVIIIGITGSAGKTSTMLAIVAALKDFFKVKYSEKANSESGIPLNILGLKMNDFSFIDWLRVTVLSPLMLLINWQDYDVYVVEMGVDEPHEPKNMGYLLKIIKPDIGVFIGISLVHSLQFESVAKGAKGILNAIADEKARLISALPKDGYAVLNLEDEFVKQRKHFAKAEVIAAKRVKIGFKNYVLPAVYEINFGLALGVAKALEVSKDKAIKGIKKYFHLPPGRVSLLKGIKDSLIIDSSYNSSLKTALMMLDLLGQLGRKLERKKIAVLGDMRELGKQTKIEHERLVEKAVRVADEIVLVGKEMKQYFLPKALELGFKKENISYFKTAWLAADFLKDNLKGKEWLLIKGSQNTILLEIIVKALMKDKKQADKLLCRRGKFWDGKREELKYV